jgi:hypothetical protein
MHFCSFAVRARPVSPLPIEHACLFPLSAGTCTALAASPGAGAPTLYVPCPARALAICWNGGLGFAQSCLFALACIASAAPLPPHVATLAHFWVSEHQARQPLGAEANSLSLFHRTLLSSILHVKVRGLSRCQADTPDAGSLCLGQFRPLFSPFPAGQAVPPAGPWYGMRRRCGHDTNALLLLPCSVVCAVCE